MPFATVKEAIEEVRKGNFLIIVDDYDRENEGDLAIAAEKVTPEAINFMARHARGLICMPVIGKRLDELQVPLMVQDNTSKHGTAFTISVEAKHHTSTGISAQDRAATIKTILDPATRPEDLARPGHTFPLRAKEGGVLVRAGHTEAIVDLARLAGLSPAGAICEILNEDGSIARLPELEKLAERSGLKVISVADIIAYRRRTEKLVEKVAEARLPTRYGKFRATAYKSTTDPDEHVALVMGEVAGEEPVLVRVHSECLTGDVFGSLRCDCGDQIDLGMKAIAKEGKGVFLYMRQEGRGIGFHNKLKAYALQDQGLDTVEANRRLGFPADLRDYGIGAQILSDLGIKNLRLLTNNPKKVVGLEGYGLKVVETVPLIATPNPYNRQYLVAKEKKMGHRLGMEAKNEDL